MSFPLPAVCTRQRCVGLLDLIGGSRATRATGTGTRPVDGRPLGTPEVVQRRIDTQQSPGRTPRPGPTRAPARQAAADQASAHSAKRGWALGYWKCGVEHTSPVGSTLEIPSADATPHPGARGPVRLAVVTKDVMTRQGASAYLATRPEVQLLPEQQMTDAEVFLVIVDLIDQDTLEIMARTAEATGTPDTRFVLVGDGLRDQHLARAVTLGLVSVLAHSEVDFDRVVAAICALRDERLDIPDEAVGWAVRRLHALYREVLGPRSLTPAGLEKREAQVLELLSQGLDTAEIAERLNYSERTVKSVIQSLLRREGLRNRAQAVAYALRTGAI
jgi:DNA-binding NarL/FixJ family response regulator